MKGAGALLLAVVLITAAIPVAAQLAAVSGGGDPRVDEILPGGDPAGVAISLANGFPLWYRDSNDRKLELCLDQEAATASGIIFPCLTEEPFPGAPISFPDNFGPEAFWWMANASAVFTSSRDGLPAGGGDALLVLAQEAAFSLDVGSVDGDQVAFGRIRIRVNVPVSGTYRVTHPYGEVDYVVPSVRDEREINQTQDVGILSPLDFTASLQNGPDQTQLPGFNPAFIPPTGAIVASAPVNIGPFLIPAAGEGAFVTALDGRRYIADPGAGPVHRTQPVTGSPTGNNVFRIELLNPPAGFTLNAADNSQVVEVAEFQLAGKLFDDGPNEAPVAASDTAVTRMGVPVVIDAAANDSDPVGPANVHGLNLQALGLPSGGRILRTEALTTAGGGTVRRTTSIPTGRASFVYTPAPRFTGVDSFSYVVQDTGGRISAPATVTVTVEDLQTARAEYRPRLGKWRIEGTSSDRSANVVTVFTGPRARLGGASVVPATSSAAQGTAQLKVAGDAVDFALQLDPLPPTAVTAVRLHLGGPGENGPVLFFLYDRVIEPPFTGSIDGALTGTDLIVRPARGIHSFDDAVREILAGNAYLTVTTMGNPGGEIRGELQLSTVGTTTVDPVTGRWSFFGKSRTVPSLSAGIVVESANGIRISGTSPKMH